MLNSFNQWWKVWGQTLGFIGLVVMLNAFWIILDNEMRQHEWLVALWLFLFFGGAGWYSWQSRVHGWRLPKSIRETH